jgi:CheY-like chemotaxis protein
LILSQRLPPWGVGCLVKAPALDQENGCDAIRAIAAACNAGIPGIIATADGSAEVRADAIAGGYAFLQKPIKPAALRALISSLIVQRPAAE